MMNYCPVCKSPLVWLSSDEDSDGYEFLISQTFECTECGMLVQEVETYTRTRVEAVFEFKEENNKE